MDNVSLFAGLSGKEMASIFDLARPKEYPAGAEVVTEGEPGNSFHLIANGEAQVIIGGRALRTIGAGDYFGEMSLLDGGPRTATVVAISPLKTLAVSTTDFQRLLENNPSITRKLLVAMTALARSLMSKADQL